MFDFPAGNPLAQEGVETAKKTDDKVRISRKNAIAFAYSQYILSGAVETLTYGDQCYLIDSLSEIAKVDTKERLKDNYALGFSEVFQFQWKDATEKAFGTEAALPAVDAFMGMATTIVDQAEAQTQYHRRVQLAGLVKMIQTDTLAQDALMQDTGESHENVMTYLENVQNLVKANKLEEKSFGQAIFDILSSRLATGSKALVSATRIAYSKK